MVTKLAEYLVSRLKAYQLIQTEDSPYYKYALITIMERTISVVTILIISVCLKNLIPTVCFLVFFFALRQRTGGYHADKFWKCYIATIFFYMVISICSEKFLTKQMVLYVLSSISLVLIVIIGTVNHPNMNMNEKEMRASKRKARRNALMEMGIILLFKMMGINNLCLNYMMSAIILCALLLVLAKIIKQEVKGEDEKGTG